jgi:hypothetical protein
LEPHFGRRSESSFAPSAINTSTTTRGLDASNTRISPTLLVGNSSATTTINQGSAPPRTLTALDSLAAPLVDYTSEGSSEGEEDEEAEEGPASDSSSLTYADLSSSFTPDLLAGDDFGDVGNDDAGEEYGGGEEVVGRDSSEDRRGEEDGESDARSEEEEGEESGEDKSVEVGTLEEASVGGEEGAEEGRVSGSEKDGMANVVQERRGPGRPVGSGRKLNNQRRDDRGRYA